MSLPIFIQKEMHDKKVDQLFVQVSVRIENKKSNPAMQALFGKPVATKQEKKKHHTVLPTHLHQNTTPHQHFVDMPNHRPHPNYHPNNLHPASKKKQSE